MKNILNKIKEKTEPLIEEMGYDLVDLEYVRESSNRFLRFYIGKRGGVSIDDCQNVSEMVSDILDEMDPINESYYLEVSSPGLDRPLKTNKDLDRNIDYEVELNFYTPVDGIKKQVGTLKEYSDDSITLILSDNKEFVYSREDISVIKIAINI